MIKKFLCYFLFYICIYVTCIIIDDRSNTATLYALTGKFSHGNSWIYRLCRRPQRLGKNPEIL